MIPDRRDSSKYRIRSMKEVIIKRSATEIQDSDFHYIRFDKASVLARERLAVPREIREAVDI